MFLSFSFSGAVQVFAHRDVPVAVSKCSDVGVYSKINEQTVKNPQSGREAVVTSNHASVASENNYVFVVPSSQNHENVDSGNNHLVVVTANHDQGNVESRNNHLVVVPSSGNPASADTDNSHVYVVLSGNDVANVKPDSSHVVVVPSGNNHPSAESGNRQVFVLALSNNNGNAESGNSQIVVVPSSHNYESAESGNSHLVVVPSSYNQASAVAVDHHVGRVLSTNNHESSELGNIVVVASNNNVANVNPKSSHLPVAVPFSNTGSGDNNVVVSPSNQVYPILQINNALVGSSDKYSDSHSSPVVVSSNIGEFSGGSHLVVVNGNQTVVFPNSDQVVAAPSSNQVSDLHQVAVVASNRVNYTYASPGNDYLVVPTGHYADSDKQNNRVVMVPASNQYRDADSGRKHVVSDDNHLVTYTHSSPVVVVPAGTHESAEAQRSQGVVSFSKNHYKDASSDYGRVVSSGKYSGVNSKKSHVVFVPNRNHKGAAAQLSQEVGVSSYHENSNNAGAYPERAQIVVVSANNQEDVVPQTSHVFVDPESDPELVSENVHVVAVLNSTHNGAVSASNCTSSVPKNRDVVLASNQTREVPDSRNVGGTRTHWRGGALSKSNSNLKAESHNQEKASNTGRSESTSDPEDDESPGQPWSLLDWYT